MAGEVWRKNQDHTEQQRLNVWEENKEINKDFMADIQIKLDGEGIMEKSQPSHLTVKQETAAVGIRLAPLKNRHWKTIRDEAYLLQRPASPQHTSKEEISQGGDR